MTVQSPVAGPPGRRTGDAEERSDDAGGPLGARTASMRFGALRWQLGSAGGADGGVGVHIRTPDAAHAEVEV